tara:strand:+ start:276 stop:521 length:246 start_codon:yes stop_codon:yes gene_type:complete
MELDPWLIDVLMTVISSALFGLIGFVWKISHKVTSHEKEIQTIKQISESRHTQTKHDVEYLISKVDKNNDKMYSIVKNLKD